MRRARDARPRSLVSIAHPERRRTPMPRDLAHLSDEAVLALVGRSEEAALAELYDRYGGAAYRLARRVVRDPNLAEDAVQDAFLAIWRGAARFVPDRRHAAAWIMTVVHRRAVDIVRREEHRRAKALDPADDSRPDRSAAEAVWLRLERERVQLALARLPDAQREVLELAYYGGFTQSELAERLGRPLGTIKSQMYTALHNLKDLIEGAGEEETWKKS